MRPSPPRSSVYLAAILASGCGGASLLASGCDANGCDTAPESHPPTDFRGGSRVESKGGAVYETSAQDGAHLNFNGGAQFRIYHQLGGRPVLVQPWVSFSATGTKRGNEAVPSGNMAEVLCVNEEFILIRNNGCADYWLRVVASNPAPPVSPTALDSSCVQ